MLHHVHSALATRGWSELASLSLLSTRLLSLVSLASLSESSHHVFLNLIDVTPRLINDAVDLSPPQKVELPDCGRVAAALLRPVIGSVLKVYPLPPSKWVEHSSAPSAKNVFIDCEDVHDVGAAVADIHFAENAMLFAPVHNSPIQRSKRHIVSLLYDGYEQIVNDVVCVEGLNLLQSMHVPRWYSLWIVEETAAVSSPRRVVVRWPSSWIPWIFRVQLHRR